MKVLSKQQLRKEFKLNKNEAAAIIAIHWNEFAATGYRKMQNYMTPKQVEMFREWVGGS
jgi:hypothetical protein